MNSVVYFIRAVGYPLVKIGHAKNPGLRLRELQIGCPLALELEATVEGDGNTERLIHRALSGHGFRGEWYCHNEVVRDFIARLRASPLPPNEFAAAEWEHRIAAIRERVSRNREAADQIIATVMPLSSAGEAA